jgi:DNA polymerase I-like protein with 3'-5' exonuclease and polymerase domains
MARWIRSLINPPEGCVFIEPDWSSQEFLIAAVLSGDKNMIQAYNSGDPYVFFAKAAGAIPPEGSKKTHPEMRSLFKSTVLGLQYGMGYDKLARKLSADTGKPVSEATAKQLIDLHKKIFPRLWAWRAEIINSYKRKGFYVLSDGWTLLPDNNADLSTANFPVQGTGGVIFREAMRLCMQRDLQVVYGLHDAIRILSKVEYIEKNTEILVECMRLAVEKYISEPIRNDVKVIKHGEPYIEEGAEKLYERMKIYLDTRFLDETEEKETLKLFTNSA